ncbi:MAG: hypothetical protein H6551_10220 [Chitinophagales bacterium]|nr:hypothetical protein [Chitinophagaceae bacterium]MCB9065502.1 hypothetical protein [Chitinophagales bacterium]
MSDNKKTETAILWMVAVGVTFLMMPELFLHPGSVMLSIGGDAVKNYFSFAYHAQYGSGFHFEGMNYPYGEHIVYADGQLLFSVFLAKLLPISALAAMHWLIIAGFISGIYFSYKVLRNFNVSFVWALVFGVVITVMSPQVFRLSGHFSLAYVCLMPILFYLTQRYRQAPSFKCLLLLFIFTICAGLVHIYYLAIIGIWVLFLVPVSVLIPKDTVRLNFNRSLLQAIVVGVAIFLSIVVVLATDNVVDRPVYPSNARAHVTGLMDIFTSSYSYIWQWFSGLGMISKPAAFSEGYVYIGVVPALMLLCYPVYLLVSLIRRKELKVHGQYVTWFFVAAGMLFFGSGILFLNCHECLDNAASFRQFRALGRFSWGFYYPIVIVSVVLLYNAYLFLAQKNRRVANVVFTLAVVLWLLDGLPYATYARTLAKNGSYFYENFNKENGKNWNDFLKEKGLNGNNFQSVLFMPYVHIGSEKLGRGSDYQWFLNKGFSASWQLQLPLMDVMMSRTSWSQTFAQTRTFGGPFSHKDVLHSLPNDKPILLLKLKEYELNPDEQFLIDASVSIGEFKDCDVYKFYPEKLFITQQAIRDRIQPLIDSCENDTVICVGCTQEYFLRVFEDKEPVKENIKQIAVFTASDTLNGMYEFSAQISPTWDNYRMPSYDIVCYNTMGDILGSYTAVGANAIAHEDGSLRVSKYFTMPEGCTKVSIKVINVPNPAYQSQGAILLRPTDATIIHSVYPYILVNNHIYIDPINGCLLE